MTNAARIPWWRSVRVRIAVTVTMVSLLVSGVVGLVLAQRSATAARESLRTEALGRLAVVTDGYAVDGRLRFGATLDEAFAPAALHQRLSGRQAGTEATYFDGSRMWAAGRLGPQVVLTIALDGRALAVQDDARLRALGIAGGAAILGSVVLGWAAGTTLSRRLRRAAGAAREIADGSATARAGQRGRDEVALLLRAVDDMASALNRRLTAEQEFTSDVAHELRTPLTGLVSATELLPDGPAAELVRTQVARMRRLIEDLLEISRLDRGGVAAELEPVDLGAAIHAALGRLSVEAEALNLVIEGEPTHTVLIDARRLDRILGNLLINLARHGGGRGSLAIRGRSFTLDDAGAGYPADLIEHGPRAFHAASGTSGSGLGLTIAVKHAVSMDARVEFGRAPAGGARTVVTFAEPDRRVAS